MKKKDSAVSQKPAVLVLGAGLMQMPLLFAVKKLGYSVIACDANKLAVGRLYCDEFWNIDISDAESIITFLTSTKKKYTIAAVTTAATDFSYSVAKVACALALPALDLKTARNFIFKDEMRLKLQKKRVAVPEFLVTSSLAVTKSGIKILGYPLVSKPLHNMGGRGVQKIFTQKELKNAVLNSQEYSKEKKILVESMLEGPELSIDALFYKGKFYVLAVADRHIHFSPYCIETGHSIPSALPASMVEDACKETEKAARALGMEHGICKADIIFHRNKAHIGELASRLSGGYMSGWTAPAHYRKDFSRSAVQLAAGKKPDREFLISNNPGTELKNVRQVTAERSLLSLPGKIVSYECPEGTSTLMKNSLQFSPAYFEQLKHCKNGIFAIFLHRNAGEKSVLPENNTEITASLLLKERNIERLNYRTACALAQIFVNVEINQEANDFLFSDSPEQSFSPWRCFDSDAWSEKRENWEGRSEKSALRGKLESYIRIFRKKKNFFLTVPLTREFTAYSKEKYGTWTHVDLKRALEIALENKLVYTKSRATSTEEILFQKFIWRAFLRSGWQGLYYLRKLMQECPYQIAEYL